MCWVVPSVEYSTFGPDTGLERVPGGTIGLYIGFGNNGGGYLRREILLIEDKFISIIEGHIEKFKEEE